MALKKQSGKTAAKVETTWHVEVIRFDSPHTTKSAPFKTKKQADKRYSYEKRKPAVSNVYLVRTDGELARVICEWRSPQQEACDAAANMAKALTPRHDTARLPRPILNLFKTPSIAEINASIESAAKRVKRPPLSHMPMSIYFGLRSAHAILRFDPILKGVADKSRNRDVADKHMHAVGREVGLVHINATLRFCEFWKQAMPVDRKLLALVERQLLVARDILKDSRYNWRGRYKATAHIEAAIDAWASIL